MTGKKLLKILAISASAIILVFGIMGVWLLSMLPGPSKVKEAVQSSVAQIEKKDAESSVKTQTSASENASENAAANTVTSASDASSGKSHMPMEVIYEDFANPSKPLVETCRDLAKAGESGFFPKTQNRTAVKFMDNIASSQKDPVLESVAPVMRYVFRLPGVGDALHLIKGANGDDSLIQKAELYRHFYRAASYLQSNAAEMNQVIQKSYNLHMLSKAVALKPQLASDSSVMSFCEQIEGSLLGNQKVNVEEQVQEMRKFLQDAGIDEKSIGFDANYRSKVEVDLGKGHFSVSDPWLKDLVSKGMM
ncbi:hypothetical protein ACLVWU_08995 [Bdellovibrio sp. HCB290]|uniref:hypothetical protein n=1 Tax=Bdellovibrio sp. HCB290 TaxID=3394356 RepID=UPI0039B678FE